MTAPLGWTAIAKVAERFHSRVREELREHVAEIDEINARRNDCCATHLFCDPNDLFAEAFVEVMGRHLDVQSGFDLSAYDVAWGLARRRGFGRTWGLGR